jgi:hypothetical protein
MRTSPGVFSPAWRWQAAALIAGAWLTSTWAAGTPAAVPARLLLGFSGDPATSQAVTWRTTEPSLSPQVQLTIDRPGPDLADGASTIHATSAELATGDGGTAFHHAAALAGLRPSTRYAYRVGDGTAWSSWHTFATADVTPKPFRFLYLGDSQNGLADAWPRVIRTAETVAPDARLVVHAGDLLAEGYDDALWGQWIEGLGRLASGVPHVAVPGNHDEHRGPGEPFSGKVHGVSGFWRAYLRLPQTGPDGLPDLPGQSYYLDYQGVRFVAVDVNAFANDDYLDSERAGVRQAILTWLERVLAPVPGRWTIVVQHQPFYALAKSRNYREMREWLGPIYDRGRVDLVLQGHDHVYARTHKVRNGQTVGAADRGAVYALAVSGVKMYEVTEPQGGLMAKLVEGVQTFQVVAVSPARLTYTSYAADRSLVDAFDLVRSGGGTRYINRAPAVRAPR